MQGNKSRLAPILVLFICLLTSLYSFGESFNIQSVLNLLNDSHATINRFSEDIEAEVFKDLKLKMKQMTDNYSYNQTNSNEIQFISEDATGCSKTTPSKNTVVSTISYQNQLTTPHSLENLSEFITYTGCDNKFLFQERLYQEGKNLKPLTKKEVLDFKRKLSLENQELNKTYELADHQGRVIFKYSIQKYLYLGYETTQIKMILSDQEIIEIIEQKNTERVFISVKLNPFSFSYDFYNSYFTRIFNNSVLLYADISKEGEKYFQGVDKELISKKTFDSYYSGYFLNYAYANVISSILKKIIEFFPSTEVITSGQRYSKLSRQLEDIRLKLINGNYPEARNDIEQILLDVLNGSIQDFRPQ